jgi:uncharacterized membrane protein
MLKSITPIWSRLRHIHRPELFLVRAHAPVDGDQPTVGQRLAERVAASVGSWWFLGGQAFFLFLWLVYNTLVFTRHFDNFPYILLNLLLSFQAAFTGPVLLIAANVGALRDHEQADRIEQLSQQNEDLGERLLAVEEMLEQHITRSLAGHAAELVELKALLREVHTAVCAVPAADGASEPSTKTAKTRSRAVSRVNATKAAPQGG